MRKWLAPLVLSVAVSVGVSGCNGVLGDPRLHSDAGDPPGTDDPPPYVFEPLAAPAAVSKVKQLLTGLPPTADEVTRVAADPNAMASLVQGWMATPQYEAKMRAFFATSFQQSQITVNSLVTMFPQDPVGFFANPANAPALGANVMESFARTAIEFAKEGTPFNQTVNTNRLMMTPALMALYGVLDSANLDDHALDTHDALAKHDRLSTDSDVPQYYATLSVIDPIDSVTPGNPNYLHFTNGMVGTQLNSGTLVSNWCLENPRVNKPNTTYAGYSYSLWRLMLGDLASYADRSKGQVTHNVMDSNVCNAFRNGGNVAGGVLTATDFTDWRMVTIRQPHAGEKPTPFWQMAKLRTASELVLALPRIGFFTTPAFFANWPTNGSNLARVTMNQTLIVALGHSFDGTNSITPVSEPALDGEHAAPGTSCYGCHQTLDPMRQFFRQSYSVYYGGQADPAETSLNGVFAFDGVTAAGTNLSDLANQLANHPRFAQAWVQKLCTYANSAPCDDTGDPEFARVVNDFKQSGYNWNKLVVDLFSSPMVTYKTSTSTAIKTQQTVTVNREEHLCSTLSFRLGVSNICGVEYQVAPRIVAQSNASHLAVGLPAAVYSRAQEQLAFTTDPSIFYRIGLENLCQAIVVQLVDGTGFRYSSRKPDDAVKDMVENVMGLPPGDARHDDVTAVLIGHFNSAVASKASPSDAMRSTFMLACTSPGVAAIGL